MATRIDVYRVYGNMRNDDKLPPPAAYPAYLVRIGLQ